MTGYPTLPSCARLSAPVRRMEATLGSDLERRRRAGVGGGSAGWRCLPGVAVLSTPTLAQGAKPTCRVAAGTPWMPHRRLGSGRSTLTPTYLVSAQTDIFAEQLADIFAEQQQTQAGGTYRARAGCEVHLPLWNFSQDDVQYSRVVERRSFCLPREITTRQIGVLCVVAGAS
jgi:hypothetical protein